MTTTIRGDGLLAGAACPTPIGPDLQSFPVEAIWSDSLLICEQVIVPNVEMRFPPVAWSFFDSQKQQYRVLSANINSQVIAAQPSPQSVTLAPTIVNSASSRKSPVQFSRYSVILLIAVFALIAVAAVAVRRRNKPPSETVLQADLSALKKMLQAAEAAALEGNVELFYNRAFEIIQIMQSVEKFYRMPSAPAVTGCYKNRLYVSDNAEKPNELVASESLGILTEACDKVRYGRVKTDSASITADLELLRRFCCR